MIKIVLATQNDDKIVEIGKMLNGLELKTYKDFDGLPDVVEDTDTFAGNALKKAREVSTFTNMMALADDSGLVVKSLNGAPGVLSARFAGEDVTYQDNNAKLLNELAGVQDRAAYFICVMCLYFPDGTSLFTRGFLHGEIAEAPAGPGGFGNDPVFYHKKHGKTVAELSLAEKNKISHRSQALRRMQQALKRYYS